MYKFKIEKILVNTANGIEEIVPKKINILVGPNNSGKSRILKEIRDYLSGDNRDIKIIQKVEYTFPKEFSELDEAYNISSKMAKEQYGNWMLKSYSNKQQQILDVNAPRESYFTQNIHTFGEDWAVNFNNIVKQNQKIEFLMFFGALFFQYLGTEERLTICKLQSNYGFDSTSINFLSSIKFQDELLQELAYKVKQIFSKDIYLDERTLGNRLVFRVGENLEYARKAAYTKEDATRLFSETALDDQGDGLKSFVSTFLSLHNKENDILLLDEPEAFLHPPLARQLGEMIGDFSSEDHTVFVATHSVEVLKGILSKNQEVNVIRITQPEDNINEVKVLDQEILKSILHNPLLRVSRVLEGIFCEKVIITEAEADELVYQELSEIIAPESGAYFVHGQNKQTLAKIAELYQKIGVAYEVVTDFDILSVSSELYQFLQLMPIEEGKRQKIIFYAKNLTEQVNNTVNVEGLSEKDAEDKKKKRRREVYHTQGIRFFHEELQPKIKRTLSALAEHHLHIIETGELETLLEEYGVEYQDKKDWIIEAINKIAELKKEGIDPESYIYQFIHNIIYNN